MATRKLTLPIAGFSDGLNTEASALNILPSELMDGSINVELEHNGSIKRRNGVDFFGESASGDYLHTIRTAAASSEPSLEVPSAFYFRITAPNGTQLDRIVVNIDDDLRIYEATSTALKNFDTPLQTIALGDRAATKQRYADMTFASSGDKLFFAGVGVQPGYLTVTSDNSTLEATYYDVLIRDTSKNKTNIRVKNTVSSVSRWYECIEDHTSAAANEPGVGADWERYWFELDGAPPSSGLGSAAWANGTAYTTTFVKQYNKLTTMTDRINRPSCVEFYASRVWLSGDPVNPNTVYFSQAIVKDADISKFHQYADPYDEADPELVPDDGGQISIIGAGRVMQMVAISSSLFIGTTAGIWQVKGVDGIFKATDYSVHKVLTDKILGISNMVRIDQELIAFGQNAIWLSSTENSLAVSNSGTATFKSISEKKLSNLWRGAPKENKSAGRALYNQSDRTVSFFFNREATTFGSSFAKNTEYNAYSRNILVMDVGFENDSFSFEQKQDNRHVKGAFVLHELAANSGTDPYISVPFVSTDIPSATETVVVGADVVVVGSDTVLTALSPSSRDTILFVAMRRAPSGSNVTLQATFGTLNAGTKTDWASVAEYTESFISKAITGLQTGGDLSMPKTGRYIYLLFKKVEDNILDASGVDTNAGGCFMRTAWQWSTSVQSNKYGDQKQVYFPARYSSALDDGSDDGHDHVWFKARVRGRGNSLQIIFENDGDKDFHLIGWSQNFGRDVDAGT